MKILAKTLLTCALTLGVMHTAGAYVGPGAGLSLLGALWGLLAAVFAALAFVLLWPLRRIIKARREKGTPARSQTRTIEGTEPSPISKARTGATSEADLQAQTHRRAKQA
jgi:membrane protein implicated in regulation of membrane protease activity